MTTRESLHNLLETLPDDQLRQVFDFASFLKTTCERDEWLQFGASDLARAYGDDEPEYDDPDVKAESN